MSDKKNYSELIKQLRKHFRESQERFARRVDVVLATIHRYEKGGFNPAPEVLAKLIHLAGEEGLTEIASGLRDEYHRLHGNPSSELQLSPENEALLSSLRAFLAEERYAAKLSNKLSSILLDMQEKEKTSVALRKKVR